VDVLDGLNLQLLVMVAADLYGQCVLFVAHSNASPSWLRLSVRCLVVVRRCSASSSRGSTFSNGQNTFGVDVLKRVAQVDGLFNGGVALAAELFVFILQVCYE
jgi:hypothetical protein